MFVLRPEQLVLSGHGVNCCMLKGGTNYSWTVMTKGWTNVRLTLYGSMLFFRIKTLSLNQVPVCFMNYLMNRHACQKGNEN